MNVIWLLTLRICRCRLKASAVVIAAGAEAISCIGRMAPDVSARLE
jgi:hypothetical protein